MKKVAYLIGILLIASTIFTACEKKTKQVSKEETTNKIEDLNYFWNTLDHKHKNLYANIHEVQFEEEINQIAEMTDTMSDTDFYFSLKHLLAQVGDAHTNAYYTDATYKHLHALAFAIAKYEDSWHLMLLDKANEQFLGDKLISINDISIETVYEKSKSIMSFENEAWAISNFSNTINFKEALEFLGIVEKEEAIVLKVESQDGIIHEITMKPYSEDEIMNLEIVACEKEEIPRTSPEGIYRRILWDENNLIIQYNACQEDPNFPMKDFIQLIKTELMEKNYKNVIIDLRYNSGGDSSIFEPMIHMLKKLQKEREYNIYTLIGKYTFSSGIINAIQTKNELNSTLVGTPTGGNVNGYGELKSFELKNYPITVYYSTKYFELVKGYTKDSLYPDIEVNQRFDDYIKGRDVEVELIVDKTSS